VKSGGRGRISNLAEILRTACAAREIWWPRAEFKPCRDFADRLRGPRNLVAKGGIEPPTHGFSVRCSTN
jgi:hypothetical protein